MVEREHAIELGMEVLFKIVMMKIVAVIVQLIRMARRCWLSILDGLLIFFIF